MQSETITDTKDQIVEPRIFNSQLGEDIFIYRNFINQSVENGTFVELGACDGVFYSNTAFFEKYLGFKGILIEPIPAMYEKLTMNRKDNILHNNVISQKKGLVKLFMRGAVSGIQEHMPDSFIKKWHRKSSTIEVESKTLSEIFSDNNISYIDFLSLDVECGELDVLKTIDWNKISIYLICIELADHRDSDSNEKCREILRTNGFVFQHKIVINEFWVNPNYFRKGLLYDPSHADSSKSNIFSKDLNTYGKHIFLKGELKPKIEASILEYENA